MKKDMSSGVLPSNKCHFLPVAHLGDGWKWRWFCDLWRTSRCRSRSHWWRGSERDGVALERIWIFLEDLFVVYFLWVGLWQEWEFCNQHHYEGYETVSAENSRTKAQVWSFHLKKWVSVLSIFQHNKHGAYQATVDEGNPFVLRVHWWTNRGCFKSPFLTWLSD